ncbi:hypothetical protein J7T55_003802 [Diaporthe amygdali]|uniref:uncharacterized protein n=1 Tax=Phomopsis amygdali TaxID=1214568 RepID=UPI0022FEC818|nr:uncharacterized protein J7T55_003802 [Diaporthe amygdali]KAJ0117388.1 hypothetical protein J7T55_003802 [Diaporthe amygdali]
MPSSEIRAEDFCDFHFDFLIVGGGTAGLAVASRLSENASLKVGVLEAGLEVYDNERVDIPGWFGTTLGTELDWQFETTPQAGLGGRTLPWPRGKGLGGTSLLNFMTWNRASKQDYDAWERLGCKGWGWDGIIPFLKKSEKFHAPSQETQVADKAYYDASGFGTSGPINVSYATEYSASHQYWHDTLQQLGKILLEKHDGLWTAKGVQFTSQAKTLSVFASKEVIICAGTVQSPQILELSGIGNTEVLKKAGIETIVSSPFVGENLQDHIMAASIYEVDSDLPNPDDLKTSTAAAAAREEYKLKNTGLLTILANSICYLSLSQIMSDDTLSRLTAKARSIQGDFTERNEIRRDRFDTSFPRLGQIEYIFDLGNWNPYFQPDASSSGKKYGTMLQILQYPFSRGSIHVQSSSPFEKPVVDPRYYQKGGGDLDLEIMIECAKFAEKITQTLPLASIVRGRVVPPAPAKSDDELRDWLVKETITDWHPIGTCGMGGDRGIAGGVVDERLRVYGVKGLRLVDASVMPLQISAHLQATVYAIAEKGACMILEDLQDC